MKKSMFGVRAFSCNRSEPDIANMLLERCISFNNKSVCLSKKPQEYGNEDAYQTMSSQTKKRPCSSFSFIFGLNSKINTNKHDLKKIKLPIQTRKNVRYYSRCSKKDNDRAKLFTAGHQIRAIIPDSPLGSLIKDDRSLNKSGKFTTFSNIDANRKNIFDKPSTAARHTKYLNLFVPKKNAHKINTSFLYIDCHRLRDSLPAKQEYNLQAESPLKNTILRFKQLVVTKCRDSSQCIQSDSVDLRVIQRKPHNNSCLFQDKVYNEEAQNKNDAIVLPYINQTESKRKVILMKMKKDIL